MRNEDRSQHTLAAFWTALAALLALPASALDLRAAAWNLEHLADETGEGCVVRPEPDYAALAERIDAFGVDVLAFQDVENAAAGKRVLERSAGTWTFPRAARRELAPRAGDAPKPARSGTSTSSARCSSGSKWIRLPAGPPRPRPNAGRSSLASPALASPCAGAGPGWVWSVPLMISATRCAGASRTSW